MSTTIVRLQAENFLRLRAVDITPGRPVGVIEIAGKNGAGKSSVLDAIWSALCGRRVAPNEPVRKGAKKATVTIELGGDRLLTVERRFTKSSSNLRITDAEGEKIARPQELLDALIGALTFDPLAFLRQSASEQAEVLARIAGFDLAKWEKREGEAVEARRRANAAKKDADAAMRNHAMLKDARSGQEVEPIDTASVGKELATATKTQGERERCRVLSEAAEEVAHGFRQKAVADRDAAEELARTVEERVEAFKAKCLHEVKCASDVADASRMEAEKQRGEADSIKKDFRSIPDQTDRIADLSRQLDEADEINKIVEQRKAYGRAVERARLAREDAEDAAKGVDLVREERTKALFEANLPVDGLTFDTDTVRHNGIPLAQISQAEQIRVGVAIAAATNPEIKIVRITDGSLLDHESMAELAKIAQERDLQVWVERVGDGGQGAIVIEDGEVVD